MNEDVQVRLALSLHCATDEERTALLPANRRYGGLDELMSTIREYITVKKSRVTLEWALIEGKNRIYMWVKFVQRCMIPFPVSACCFPFTTELIFPMLSSLTVNIFII